MAKFLNIAPKRWCYFSFSFFFGAFPGGSFLEKVGNIITNSSRSTKFTKESCAARKTVEPACPNDTITLVRSRVEKTMFCSPYCLVVSLYPDKTEKTS